MKSLRPKKRPRKQGPPAVGGARRWPHLRKAERLVALLEDCAEPGWDRYQALPLRMGAVADALRFIDALPAGVAVPDVTPEPGGSVGLEWRHGDRLLVVSLLGDGRLAYGGVLAAGDKAHGSRSFVREIPQPVLDILARDFAAR